MTQQRLESAIRAARNAGATVSVFREANVLPSEARITGWSVLDRMPFWAKKSSQECRRLIADAQALDQADEALAAQPTSATPIPKGRKASEQYRIALVRQATGCAAWEARDYLEAEEWDVADAVLSYRGDKKTRAGAFGAI